MSALGVGSSMAAALIRGGSRLAAEARILNGSAQLTLEPEACTMVSP